MTVQDVQPAIVYTLTGISDYSFNFEIFEDSNLTVVYADDIGSSPVTWVLNVDYTVTINPDRTGYITVTDTGAAGEITISRQLPRTQEVAWVNNDPLDMVVQENSFDKLTMLIQEIDSTQIAYPPGFPLDVEFPYPESEKIIGWNTAGNSLVNYPSYGSFQTLHDEAVAAAAAAAISEANAAASEAAAAISETNAAASETAAGISEANAAASEAAVAGAEANCAAAETAAIAAQVAAEAAQSNAEDAEANAEISAQEAANCAADAASSSFANWEDVGNALRPKVDDNDAVGDATHMPSNIFIANDPTADEHAVRKAYLDAVVYNLNDRTSYLDNGDFQIWQRATSQTSSDLGSDDRWVNGNSVTTKTHSRQTFTLGQTDVPGNPKYYSRTVVTTGSTAASFCTKYQRILKVTRFSGKTITLSFWAKADSSKNIATEFLQVFGTGGSPSSAVTEIGVTTYSLTSSWQYFTTTVTIPSVSGKTLGSDDNDSFWSRFWFEAGSDYDSRTNSLGNQSGTFDIANVQLEEGSIATEFESMSFEDQLLSCLPYYQNTYEYGEAVGTATDVGSIGFVLSGVTSAASDYIFGYDFKIPFITIPAITIYSTSGAAGYVNGYAVGDVAVSSTNVNKKRVNVVPSTISASSYRGLQFHVVADTGY